jgi:hypothetical protein
MKANGCGWKRHWPSGRKHGRDAFRGMPAAMPRYGMGASICHPRERALLSGIILGIRRDATRKKPWARRGRTRSALTSRCSDMRPLNLAHDFFHGSRLTGVLVPVIAFANRLDPRVREDDRVIGGARRRCSLITGDCRVFRVPSGCGAPTGPWRADSSGTWVAFLLVTYLWRSKDK